MMQWLTHNDVQRNPEAGYTHLVRAAGDPERSGAAKEQGRGWTGYVLQRKLKQGCLGDFTGSILGLLGDGVARTFNRIAVELLDVTADVAFGTPFEAARAHAIGRVARIHLARHRFHSRTVEGRCSIIQGWSRFIRDEGQAFVTAINQAYRARALILDGEGA